MSSPPAFKYSHHTLVFYPQKNPEIAERQHLAKDENHESSRYLRRRSNGFLFLRWLQNDFKCQDTVVGLYASVDRPQELVVIKKLTTIIRSHLAADEQNPMAAEIEHCTMSNADPLVQRQLPLFHDNMGPTPFPQMHAFQVHDYGSPVQGEDDDAPRLQDADVTMIYKYYNGGTLRELWEKYRAAGRTIPEGFIWHFISQVCRAMSWMHTGIIPSKEYNLFNQNDIGKIGITVNRAEKAPGWKPLCHMDMHMSNIWLHYPSDEEKKADPRLEQFTNALPQIIVGDFGFSFKAENDRADLLCSQENPGIPEPETMRDKADLASALWHLLKLQVTDAERVSFLHRNAFKTVPFDSADTFDLSEWMRHNYSRDLATCWDAFRKLRALDNNDQFYENMPKTTKDDWRRLPLNDFVYGTMIAMADRYLDGYIGSGKEESVQWTQPRNAYMPYHSMWRSPKQHRWDWARVDGHLMRARQAKFRAYGLEHVKIHQAHIVGAGTPERELDQVDFGSRSAPEPTSPAAPSTPTAVVPAGSQDSLPDYVDSEEEDPTTTGQVQAHRATVQPRRMGYSSPTTPDEDRDRERYQQRVYAQKCRVRGFV
jgi:serine/threonine protein kinase